MKKTQLTRQELYDLVWDQPINMLIRTLNIESKRLREICADHNIPLPKNGYWSQIRFDKDVVKIPLPRIENNFAEIDLNSKTFRTEYHRRAYDLEQRKELRFKVPESISTYHPIVKSSKKLIENIEGSKDKFKFWQVSQEKDILPIHTDSMLRARALRFMDTLIRVVEAMGHKIAFKYNVCHVEMFGQLTEINLRQKEFRIRIKDETLWSSNSWQKSNKLEFQAGPSFKQKKWIDGDRRKLEEFLPEIIAWIEIDCKYWHDLRAEQAIAENKRILEQQKLEEIKKQKELEQAKVNQLFVDAENWNLAEVAERYINEMEKQAILNNQMNPNTENYLDWARKVINRLNPLNDKFD